MDIEETGTVTKMAGNAEVVYFFNDKKIWLDEIMILLKDLCAGKMPAVLVSPPSWWQERMDIEETGTVTKMAGNAEVVYFFNDKKIWLDEIMILLKDLCAGKMPAVLLCIYLKDVFINSTNSKGCAYCGKVIFIPH
ncbi:MAG: hypothetical protein ACLFUS_03620 [Candidatus Sumerlaeia bacterium]